MKKFYILAVSVTLLGVIAVPSAFAKKHKTVPPTQTTPSDVYAKYDANSNGTLEAAEKAALQKDATNPLLKPYDLNNDGKLSDDEVAAIPATKIADAPAKEKKHKKNK